MERKDRRGFSRVHLQWSARLDFGIREYKRFVHDVSLSGLYVEGNFRQSVGDLCVINLKQSCLFVEDAVHAVGSIARISERGVAVEFLSMKLDSFFFLQAMLFSKAVNPGPLGKEFISSTIFELENDLIVFQPSPQMKPSRSVQENQENGSVRCDEPYSSRLIHSLQRHSSVPPRGHSARSDELRLHQNAQEFLSPAHKQQQL